jgi:hypothetical protein
MVSREGRVSSLGVDLVKSVRLDDKPHSFCDFDIIVDDKRPFHDETKDAVRISLRSREKILDHHRSRSQRDNRVDAGGLLKQQPLSANGRGLLLNGFLIPGLQNIHRGHRLLPSVTDLLLDRQKRRLAKCNGGTQESRCTFPIVCHRDCFASSRCLGADMLLMPAIAIYVTLFSETDTAELLDVNLMFYAFITPRIDLAPQLQSRKSS